MKSADDAVFEIKNLKILAYADNYTTELSIMPLYVTEQNLSVKSLSQQLKNIF